VNFRDYENQFNTIGYNASESDFSLSVDTNYLNEFWRGEKSGTLIYSSTDYSIYEDEVTPIRTSESHGVGIEWLQFKISISINLQAGSGYADCSFSANLIILYADGSSDSVGSLSVYCDGTGGTSDSDSDELTINVQFSEGKNFRRFKIEFELDWDVQNPFTRNYDVEALIDYLRYDGYLPAIVSPEIPAYAKIGTTTSFQFETVNTTRATTVMEFYESGLSREYGMDQDWVSESTYYLLERFNVTGSYLVQFRSYNEWGNYSSHLGVLLVGDYPKDSYLSLFSSLDGFPLDSKDFKIYLGDDDEASLVNFRDYHGNWATFYASTVQVSLIDDFLQFQATANGLKSKFENDIAYNTQYYTTLLFNFKIFNASRVIVVYNPDLYEKDYQLDFDASQLGIWYQVEIPFHFFTQYQNITSDNLYQIGFLVQDALVQISNIRVARYYQKSWIQQNETSLNMTTHTLSEILEHETHENGTVMEFDSIKNTLNYELNVTDGFNNTGATWENVSIHENNSVSLLWNQTNDTQEHDNSTTIEFEPDNFPDILNFTDGYNNSGAIWENVSIWNNDTISVEYLNFNATSSESLNSSLVEFESNKYVLGYEDQEFSYDTQITGAQDDGCHYDWYSTYSDGECGYMNFAFGSWYSATAAINPYFRFYLDIPEDAIIESANLTYNIWLQGGGAMSTQLELLDSNNVTEFTQEYSVKSLGGEAERASIANASLYTGYTISGTGDYIVNVTTQVQHFISVMSYESDNWIGFKNQKYTAASRYAYGTSWEYAPTYGWDLIPKLNITYTCSIPVYGYNLSQEVEITNFTENYETIINCTDSLSLKTNSSSGNLYSVSIFNYSSSNFEFNQSFTDSYSDKVFSGDYSLFSSMNNSQKVLIEANSSQAFKISVNFVNFTTMWNDSSFFNNGFYLSELVNFDQTVNVTAIAADFNNTVNTTLDVYITDNSTGDFNNWVNYTDYTNPSVQFLKYKILLNTSYDQETPVFNSIQFNYSTAGFLDFSDNLTFGYYTGTHDKILSTYNILNLTTTESIDQATLSIYNYSSDSFINSTKTTFTAAENFENYSYGTFASQGDWSVSGVSPSIVERDGLMKCLYFPTAGSATNTYRNVDLMTNSGTIEFYLITDSTGEFHIRGSQHDGNFVFWIYLDENEIKYWDYDSDSAKTTGYTLTLNQRYHFQISFDISDRTANLTIDDVFVENVTTSDMGSGVGRLWFFTTAIISGGGKTIGAIDWSSADGYHVGRNQELGTFTLMNYQYTTSDNSNDFYNSSDNSQLFRLEMNSSTVFNVLLDYAYLETTYNASHYQENGYYVSNLVNFDQTVNVTAIAADFNNTVNTTVEVHVSDNSTGNFNNWVNHTDYTNPSVQFLKYRVVLNTSYDQETAWFENINITYECYSYNLTQNLNLTYYSQPYENIFQSHNMFETLSNETSGTFLLQIWEYNNSQFTNQSIISSWSNVSFNYTTNANVIYNSTTCENIFRVYGNSSVPFRISIKNTRLNTTYNKTLYIGVHSFSVSIDSTRVCLYVNNNNSMNGNFTLSNATYTFQSTDFINSSSWVRHSEVTNSSVLHLNFTFQSLLNESLFVREIFEIENITYRLISPENRQNPNALSFTGERKTLAILDYFNNTLYRQEMNYSTFIDIALPIVTLTIENNQLYPILITVQRGLGTEVQVVIPAESSISLRIFATSYRVYVRNLDLELLTIEDFSPNSAKTVVLRWGERQAVTIPDQFNYFTLLFLIISMIIIVIVGVVIENIAQYAYHRYLKKRDKKRARLAKAKQITAPHKQKTRF